MENNNEIAAARRRALAAALEQGEPVAVAPTGEVGTKEELQNQGRPTMEIPEGKLA